VKELTDRRRRARMRDVEEVIADLNPPLRRVRRIRREWPMSRFHDVHGLCKLTGTIRYPGSPNAA